MPASQLNSGPEVHFPNHILVALGDAGDSLPKVEVRAAMLEIHSNITKRFRQGIKFSFHDAEKLTASREDWGEFADNLVDVICKQMRESNFAAPDDETVAPTKNK